MTRPILYHTIEEKRAANNLSVKKYREKKALKNAQEPNVIKEIPVSYTREYHQARYRRLKEAALQKPLDPLS